MFKQELAMIWHTTHFFIADDRQPKVQEAIQLLEKLGLRKINNGTLSGTIHYYTIDFQ